MESTNIITRDSVKIYTEQKPLMNSCMLMIVALPLENVAERIVMHMPARRSANPEFIKTVNRGFTSLGNLFCSIHILVPLKSIIKRETKNITGKNSFGGVALLAVVVLFILAQKMVTRI